MPPSRFIPRPSRDLPVTPFLSAEEAWFWYARSQRRRAEGGVFEDRSPTEARPGDPDDIYRQVMALRRRGDLSRRHLSTLGEFGLLERSPDPRCREEEWPARLWGEALDRLTKPLREKGIIQ